MLSTLNAASRCVGLRMNLNKTKVMFNEYIIPEPISVEGIALEVVQKYVYLGRTTQMGRDDDFVGEITKRVQLGWAAFGKLRHIFESPLPQCLKTKVSTNASCQL